MAEISYKVKSYKVESNSNTDTEEFCILLYKLGTL